MRLHKALLLVEMEYFDPDSVVPRNSPLLVPRNLTLNGPKLLEPWVFNDQKDIHDEPWQLDGLLELENEFLNLPVRYGIFFIANQGIYSH